ncbi:MAG TPA: hypothetical protein VMM76_00595 [Pirellulaceae bacterium]|nr:hypothetical protein [Pirellulaceae bacterium]
MIITAIMHALVIDLLPPTPRDPCGIHKVIWDEFMEEDFTFPDGKDRVWMMPRTDSPNRAIRNDLAHQFLATTISASGSV